MELEKLVIELEEKETPELFRFTYRIGKIFSKVSRCWKCYGNHHGLRGFNIIKTGMSSPYNLAPLCYTCSLEEYNAEDSSQIKHLLWETREYLDRIGYEPNKDDLKFLKKYNKYYAT